MFWLLSILSTKSPQKKKELNDIKFYIREWNLDKFLEWHSQNFTEKNKMILIQKLDQVL